MIDLHDIVFRLKETLNLKHNKELSEVLGYSHPSTLSSALKTNGGTRMYKDILEFIEENNLDINYIIYNKVASDQGKRIQLYNDINTIENPSGNSVVVPEHFCTSLTKNCYKAVITKTISMEPTLVKNSIAIVDISDTKFDDGKVFLLEFEMGYAIRRVHKKFDDDESILFSTDSPVCPNGSIELNRVKFVGKVVLSYGGKVI